MFTNTASPRRVRPPLCVYRLRLSRDRDSISAMKRLATSLCLKNKSKGKKNGRTGGERERRDRSVRGGPGLCLRLAAGQGSLVPRQPGPASVVVLCTKSLRSARRYATARGSREPPANNLVISNYSYISTRASPRTKRPILSQNNIDDNPLLSLSLGLNNGGHQKRIKQICSLLNRTLKAAE